MQLLVLAQHALRGGLEIVPRGCQEIHDCSAGQILGCEPEAFGLLAQSFGLGWREIDGQLHGAAVPWRRTVQQPTSADRLRRPLSGAFGLVMITARRAGPLSYDEACTSSGMLGSRHGTPPSTVCRL